MLREEVEDLYTEYVDCLDGDELERWPELFTEECRYQVLPRENYEQGLPLAVILCESRAALLDRVEAIRRSAVFGPRRMRHLYSGLRVRPGRGGVETRAEASFVVLQTLAGDETRIFLAGRWIDNIVRDGGRLRFRERICVFDSDLVPGSLVYPV
jgi:3-phenylpropionate/cinnamic acid dioxygenase small subunit